MSNRTIQLLNETIGDPYPSSYGEETRDVLTIDLDHDKGAGHYIRSRIRREADGCIVFEIFGGIHASRRLDKRARFNASALRKLAAEYRDHALTRELRDQAIAELQRRKEAGQSY